MTSTKVPNGTSPSHGTEALTASASPSRSRYSVMTGNEPTICVSNRVAASMPCVLLGARIVAWIAQDAATPPICHDQPAPRGAECEYLGVAQPVRGERRRSRDPAVGRQASPYLAKGVLSTITGARFRPVQPLRREGHLSPKGAESWPRR